MDGGAEADAGGWEDGGLPDPIEDGGWPARDATFDFEPVEAIDGVEHLGDLGVFRVGDTLRVSGGEVLRGDVARMTLNLVETVVLDGLLLRGWPSDVDIDLRFTPFVPGDTGVWEGSPEPGLEVLNGGPLQRDAAVDVPTHLVWRRLRGPRRGLRRR